MNFKNNIEQNAAVRESILEMVEDDLYNLDDIRLKYYEIFACDSYEHQFYNKHFITTVLDKLEHTICLYENPFSQLKQKSSKQLLSDCINYIVSLYSCDKNLSSNELLLCNSIINDLHDFKLEQAVNKLETYIKSGVIKKYNIKGDLIVEINEDIFRYWVQQSLLYKNDGNDRDLWFDWEYMELWNTIGEKNAFNTHEDHVVLIYRINDESNVSKIDVVQEEIKNNLKHNGFEIIWV